MSFTETLESTSKTIIVLILIAIPAIFMLKIFITPDATVESLYSVFLRVVLGLTILALAGAVFMKIMHSSSSILNMFAEVLNILSYYMIVNTFINILYMVILEFMGSSKSGDFILVILTGAFISFIAYALTVGFNILYHKFVFQKHVGFSKG